MTSAKEYFDRMQAIRAGLANTLDKHNVRIKTLDHNSLEFIVAAITELQASSLLERAKIDFLITELSSGHFQDFFDEELNSMTEKHKKHAYVYFKTLRCLNDIRAMQHENIDIVAFLFSQLTRVGKEEWGARNRTYA